MRLAKRRRRSIEIVVDILRAASSGEGVNLTGIVYESKCNFLRTSKYVKLLASRNLLERVGSTPTLYRTTSRGNEAVRSLASANDLIFGENYDEPPSASTALQERIRAAPAARDAQTSLREVQRSFERLSRICRQRRGNQCGLSGGECDLEGCPIFGDQEAGFGRVVSS